MVRIRMGTKIPAIKSSGNTDPINWNMPAVRIRNVIAAMNPWPSAFTRMNGRMLKIWSARALNEIKKGAPGTVCEVTKESFLVNTKDGQLEVFEVQLEGKKRMKVKDFLLGYDITVGDVLG